MVFYNVASSSALDGSWYGEYIYRGATTSTTTGYGLYSRSEVYSGGGLGGNFYGIYGVGQSGTNSYGVFGHSENSVEAGYGVFGEAVGGGGINYGVYGFAFGWFLQLGRLLQWQCGLLGSNRAERGLWKQWSGFDFEWEWTRLVDHRRQRDRERDSEHDSQVVRGQ